MDTKNYCGEYVAPEVNVIEIKSRGVLCQSSNFDFSDEEHGHDYQYDAW